MPKRKTLTKAQRRKDWDAFFAQLREANKDPAFRKAAREFVAYHTGKISRFSNSANE